MIIDFVTYSKVGDYFNLVFCECTEEKYINIRFLPNVSMVFSKDKVDLSSIKMRDTEVVLLMLEEYGITLITKGL